MDMRIDKHELHRYILPLMNSNMFVIVSGNAALVIDPNEDEEALRMLTDSNIGDITVILTHEHFDHISGVNKIRSLMTETGGTCTVYSNRYCAEAVKDPDMNLARFFQAMFIMRSEEERCLAEEIFDPDYFCKSDVSFEKGTELTWDDIRLILRSTPGHSPGSICIEMYDMAGSLLAVATGDSLVEGNKVITRLPNGSKGDYKNITRPYLEGFSGNTLVLPGHGEISLMKELELG